MKILKTNTEKAKEYKAIKFTKNDFKAVKMKSGNIKVVPNNVAETLVKKGAKYEKDFAFEIATDKTTIVKDI